MVPVDLRGVELIVWRQHAQHVRWTHVQRVRWIHAQRMRLSHAQRKVIYFARAASSNRQVDKLELLQ